MGITDSDFEKHLLATFRVEADDHLRGLGIGLIALEKETDAGKRAELVETLFREIHSLKGAARAVNLVDVESVCQSLESTMAAMKSGKLEPGPQLLDVLHSAVDRIGRILGALLDGGETKDSIRETILSLSSLLDDQAPVFHSVSPGLAVSEHPARRENRPAPAASEEGGVAGTVRVPTERLELLQRLAEELLPLRLAVAERSAKLRELTTELGIWRRRWENVRSSVTDVYRSSGNEPAGGFAPLTELLEWNDTVMRSVEHKSGLIARTAETDTRDLYAIVDELLDTAKLALMLPFSYLTEVLPTTVRELSRSQGKSVGLVLQGTDIAIDRRLLQELKEPLIHLLRNCVDHGIEQPADRHEKSSEGTITIAVTRVDGNKIDISVSDDGAGIDAARVKASAVKQGFVAADESIADSDALPLIFRSGISTSPIITDVSGRGLGLAIVREKVERLGGRVSVETEAGEGTTFHLVVPLTLSRLRGLLVRVGDRKFVVPTSYVSRVASTEPEKVRTVANRSTVFVGGIPRSLVRLGDLIGVPRGRVAEETAKRIPIVLLNSGESHIAAAVDEILYDQEVLVKGLGPQLQRVRNITGAAVLGTGEVVPVLNVSDLLASAVERAAAGRSIDEERETVPETGKRKAILVVEDSITARTLIKNILEGAGFDVTTAVNGVEGYFAARDRLFDLIVSDVDMPRMNGFDLTAKIRADKTIGETPIVLVTALDSLQDRERGIEVGANAYIVKSSFEQSNLLEVINRLT